MGRVWSLEQYTPVIGKIRKLRNAGAASAKMRLSSSSPHGIAFTCTSAGRAAAACKSGGVFDCTHMQPVRRRHAGELCRSVICGLISLSALAHARPTSNQHSWRDAIRTISCGKRPSVCTQQKSPGKVLQHSFSVIPQIMDVRTRASPAAPAPRPDLAYTCDWTEQPAGSDASTQHASKRPHAYASRVTWTVCSRASARPRAQ